MAIGRADGTIRMPTVHTHINESPFPRDSLPLSPGPALTKMLEDLYALVRADKLKMPRHEPRALSEFQEAVKKAWEPMTTTKQVFSMVR